MVGDSIASDDIVCPACEDRAVSVVDAWPVKHRTVIACWTCGLLFLHPPPTDLDTYYGADGGWLSKHPEPDGTRAQTKTKRGAPALLDRLERYFPVRTPAPPARALDFGCGTGAWLNTFQDHGWATFGIEPTTQAAFVRHRRLTAIPADPVFDVAIVYHVLEHLARPLNVLQQLSGALRPGGFCFISVPRLDALPEFTDHAYCLNPRNHVVAFTEACLRGLLERAGLATVAAFHDLDEVFSKGRPIKLRLLAQKKDREGAGADPVAALHSLLASLPPVAPRPEPRRVAGGHAK